MKKRRYFNLKDFITFLNLLEENKATELCVEYTDSSIEKYNFMMLYFNGNAIILYGNDNSHAGIIQDTLAGTWDEYAEDVYEELTAEEEYRMFIEGR